MVMDSHSNLHNRVSRFHKVGNIGIFVLLKVYNKMDREISHLNYNSKHYYKYKFALKLIRLWTVFNLFPLKVVQKYQRCHFCVLRKNSITFNFSLYLRIIFAEFVLHCHFVRSLVWFVDIFNRQHHMLGLQFHANSVIRFKFSISLGPFDLFLEKG